MKENQIKLKEGQKLKITLYDGPSDMKADALAMMVSDAHRAEVPLEIVGIDDLKLKITDTELTSKYDLEKDKTIYKVIVEGKLIDA